MTKTVKVNYTPSQEALIVSASESGVLNQAAAERLASNPEMNTADGTPRTARAIIAKISRMGLPYERKAPTSKDGSPVVSKADLVAEIAKRVHGNLDGLDTAPKAALVALRDALAA